MALDTYGELKTALQAWVNDRSDVAAQAADFIALAQGHFNLELRSHQMIEQADVAVTAGSGTLPTGIVAILGAIGTSGDTLDHVDATEAALRYRHQAGGIPAAYSVIGSTLKVFPAGDATVSLTYRKGFAAFSDDSDTDWLLAAYPNLYLEAAQMEAYRYFKDTDDLAISAARVAVMIDRLNAQSELLMHGNTAVIAEGVTP